MEYFIPSITELVITHPIDVLKTRVQSGLKFSLKDSFRGLTYRGIGFVPTRTAFWWANHNSPFQKSNIIPHSLFVTVAKSIFDIPIEYLKIRRINNVSKSPALSNIASVASVHFMRNWFFCIGLFGTKTVIHSHPNKYMCPSKIGNDIGTSIIGCSIGSLISQPFDVLKTRFSTYQYPLVFSFKGLIYRMLVTTVGISIGITTLTLLNKLQ